MKFTIIATKKVATLTQINLTYSEANAKSKELTKEGFTVEIKPQRDAFPK